MKLRELIEKIEEVKRLTETIGNCNEYQLANAIGLIADVLSAFEDRIESLEQHNTSNRADGDGGER